MIGQEAISCLPQAYGKQINELLFFNNQLNQDYKDSVKIQQVDEMIKLYREDVWKEQSILFHGERDLIFYTFSIPFIQCASFALIHRVSEIIVRCVLKDMQCIVNGLQYEDELFCEADGNWKDIRKGSTNGKNLCAWCHGAGGILLSRISLLGNIDNETDEIVKEDIRNAVKTMQSHKYLQNPCVCHGIAGNAEILLTYGQQFQDQIASSTAKHFYSRLVGSVNSGTFECSRPYLYGFNIPGFMTGLAGIGYSLLRLLDPTLPSVLQINI